MEADACWFADAGISTSDLPEDEEDEDTEDPEVLLEWIERFSGHFERGDFQSAAQDAAKSPRGFLINIRVLER